MIDTAFIEQRMRDVNPVPGVEDVDSAELSRAVAAAHTRRAATMQAPTQHRPLPAPPPLRRRRAWAFVAAFAVVLASIGIAAFALRISSPAVTEESAPPTTVAETPEQPVNVDSLTWSRISLGTQGPSLSITGGGPGLVAVGTYPEADPNDLADGGGGPGWVQGYFDVPTVWTSPDGYAWSQVPSRDDTIGVFDFDGEVAGIAGRDDLLVAVAEDNVWTSPDGITWSAIPDDPFRHNVDRLHGVVAWGPGFIAFGDNEVTNRAVVWTSPDGYTWTRVSDDAAVFKADIHAITVGGPGLVAVGSGHESCEPVVWTSPDGYSWTRLPHDPTVFGDSSECGWFGGLIRISDVSAGGPGLVAVGSDLFGAQAAVWTSPDGMTWTRVPDDPAVLGATTDEPYTEMTSVAEVGDGLVAVGTMGDAAAAWTSHNGLTWTDITGDLDLTGDAGMVEVIAGGPGVVILGKDLVEDYIHRPPLIETVMWIGSLSESTR